MKKWNNISIIATLLALSSLLFIFFPTIDLSASAYFYQGHRFIWNHWNIADFSRHLIYFFISIASVFLLLFIAQSILLKMPFEKIKKPLGILIFFIISPILITNVGLKNHWGRARPIQIKQFGGTKSFTKAWEISTQCNTNCSFVCGDTAGAVSLFALLLLVERRRNRYMMGIGLALFTLWISLIRLAQGGHFLSDVLISITLNLTVLSIMQTLLQKRAHATKTYVSKQVDVKG